MRACAMRDHKLVVETLPDPEPHDGQVLVKTLACGICGSDLHMLKHADRMIEIGQRSGQGMDMDLKRDVIAAGARRSPPLTGLDLDRAFHRVYLESGNMPVSRLREVFGEEGMLE